jgi:two-component system LytT family response regulator
MVDRIRTLIVDDDALARERIRALVDLDPGLDLVGECADGLEGIRCIRDAEPQLVFLDVQMPRVDGFGVVSSIGVAKMPVTIFVSGYVDFALRAFEAYALDYLLKPFDDARFRTAVGRAREAVEARTWSGDPRIEALLSFLHAPARPRYPETLAVKAGGLYRFVPVSEIDYIVADGNHIRLFIEKSSKTVHKSLTEMESSVLDPDRFVRIHRSTIVNLARISFVEPLFHGDLSVALKDGTRLMCSRRFRPRLQEKVHFTA